MPVPASDAIASDVGHGALGVRYGLRPMRDLLGETSGQRHVWVEMRPKKLITGAWTGPTSSTYHQNFAETFDGVVLDVVGTKTSSETLARVESQARCEATAGTFWWSGSVLYVHLTAGANPASTTVVVELGVHVGTHGVVQPVLGPDRLANGTLEAWTGANPDGWSHAVGAGITLDKTSSGPLQGSYAARFALSAITPAVNGYILQDLTTLRAGSFYRVGGAYRNTCAPNGLFAALYVYDTGTVSLMPDGRETGAIGAIMADALGGGEWRRFTFDFLCPSWGTVRVMLAAFAVSGTQTGTVDFDDVSLRPIHRFAYHEPILADGALPTIDASRPDAFYGPVSVGLGSLGLLNGGGRLEPLIAGYDWHNADAYVCVGGRFANGGNEVLLDDCPVVVAARLASPRVSDGSVVFDLQDDKQLLKQMLPRRAVEDDAGVGSLDEGRPRVLAFGAVRNSSPPRIGLSANGFGIYELADTQYGTVPTPIERSFGYVGDVYSYTSEEAADKEDAAQRMILHGSDYTFTAGGGASGNTIEILTDVTPIVVTSDDNAIDFNIGGGALVAGISPRLYLPAGPGDYTMEPDSAIGELIATAMSIAAGVTDIHCTFSASTGKYTISKDAGTLQLLCSSGANRDVSLWGILGFSTAANRTGALTYTGDDIVGKLADQHVIRLNSTGYAAGYLDDASGTYTGSANAQIFKGPDIAYFLLRKVLGVPVSQIDLPSFVAGRSGAKTLAAYIGEVMEVGEIFEHIGAGENVDITSEAGIWYWRPRSPGTVPTPVVDVLESDILDLVGLYDVEDNYQVIRVGYQPQSSSVTGIGPSRRRNTPDLPGRSKTKQDATTSKAAMRFGRPDQRTWQTYLTSSVDAASRLTALATMAGKKSRRYELTVRGKALLLPVGAKLRITRSRGLGTTPPTALLVRILAKTDAWGDWTSQMLVIEDNPS